MPRKPSNEKSIDKELLPSGEASFEKLESTPSKGRFSHAYRKGIVIVSNIQILVDGKRWRKVNDLLKSGPLDRTYAVKMDSEGAVRVIFGDGKHGMRPPPGSRIEVRYRSGIGSKETRCLSISG